MSQNAIRCIFLVLLIHYDDSKSISRPVKHLKTSYNKSHKTLSTGVAPYSDQLLGEKLAKKSLSKKNEKQLTQGPIPNAIERVFFYVE